MTLALIVCASALAVSLLLWVLADRRAQRNTPLVVHFDGKCELCGETIRPGDLMWMHRGRAYHVECATLRGLL